MRVVDYAPANQGVAGEWSNWQPDAVQSDLDKIVALHANVVRVYTPRDACFPALCAASQAELSSFVSMAHASGLRVWLILAFWGDNAPSPADAATYARAVMAPYAGRTDLIAALEVFSEIIPSNMPFGWQQWAQAVVPAARQAAAGVPVTISAGGGDPANVNFATLAGGLNGTSGQPDFYDYHYYYNPADTQTNLAHAQTIAGGVPIVVGETGKQSDCLAAWLGGCSSTTQRVITCGWRSYPKWISGGWPLESAQAQYIGGVESGTLAAGLGAAGVWTLNDDAQSCSNPWGPMMFGLYRTDGSPKPAVATVTQAFIAAGG
jgi:hypothetical protein